MAKEPEGTASIVNVDVTIPQGASTETIANILKENGLIDSPVYFRVLAKLKGVDGSFQKGDFSLNTGMEEEAIMTILTTEGEKRETTTFTIPEGFTLEQIAERLAAKELCTKEEFMAAAQNGNYGYRFLEDVPDRNLRLQGFLFPSTYEVYTDATAEDIVSTMLNQFDVIFKDEYYDQAERLGYSIDDVVKIASIIEREVRVPDERPLVSSVIRNRLDINMNLEMCSTIMYVLDKSRDRVLLSDLEIDSPYNTYRNPGLPVGPISNPGEASIIAALYPEDTNYLYFVLVDDATGSHEFNSNFNDHVNAKNEHNREF